MATNWVQDYKALEQAGDMIMELIAEKNKVTSQGGEGLKVRKENRKLDLNKYLNKM